jgi:hypothetical protein
MYSEICKKRNSVGTGHKFPYFSCVLISECKYIFLRKFTVGDDTFQNYMAKKKKEKKGDFRLI